MRPGKLVAETAFFDYNSHKTRVSAQNAYGVLIGAALQATYTRMYCRHSGRMREVSTR